MTSLAILKNTSIATLALLLVLLIVNAISPEVTWKPADFIIGGFLIFGLLYGLTAVLTRVKPEFKWWLATLIILSFLFVWIGLAVG